MKTTPRSTGLALALTALCVGSAWAAPIGIYTNHFVTGSASVLAPGDGRSGGYQCNTLGTPQALNGCGIVTDPGANRVTDGGATVYGGTVGGSSALTAFTAQARANEFSYTYPKNVPTVTLGAGYSQALAGADLATGSLRASVGNNANQGYVVGSARADMHDILHLQVAGASASTVTRVNFQFAIDGVVLDDLQTTIFGERGSGSMSASLRLDDLSSAHNGSADHWLYAGSEWAIQYGNLTSLFGTQDIRGQHVGGSWTTVALDLMVFDGWMDIVGTEAIINPTLSLSVQCGIGLQCDYGNTARFRFTNMPGSVSYTSASGVFLSGLTPPPVGDVPEPASAALVLAGLAGLRCATRRRAA